MGLGWSKEELNVLGVYLDWEGWVSKNWEGVSSMVDKVEVDSPSGLIQRIDTNRQFGGIFVVAQTCWLEEASDNAGGLLLGRSQLAALLYLPMQEGEQGLLDLQTPLHQGWLQIQKRGGKKKGSLCPLPLRAWEFLLRTLQH